MRLVSTEVYEYHELSPSAQDRAFHEWVERDLYPWHEDNRKTLEAFLRVFPIKVTHWEYSVFGYRIFSESLVYDCVENLRGVRLMKYIINNFDYALHSMKTYYSGRGQARRSRIMVERDGCPLTGYCIDYDILKPIYNFLEKPNYKDSLTSLLRECLESWGRACEIDFRESTSKEYFEEQCQENGWEFYEDGSFYGRGYY